MHTTIKCLSLILVILILSVSVSCAPQTELNIGVIPIENPNDQTAPASAPEPSPSAPPAIQTSPPTIGTTAPTPQEPANTPDGATPDQAAPTPSTAAPPDDGPVILTIRGDGVIGETTWTLDQLRSMRDGYRENTYSTTNNWPSFGHMKANGISLPYLLRQAGVLSNSSSLKFTSADGYHITLTFDQAANNRQTFSNHSPSGSSGALAVEPIIAWEWGDDSVRPENIRPFFGQSGPMDVNTSSFVKDLVLIEVFNTSTGEWAAPSFSISDRASTPGAELSILHDNTDSVRIYYTLDGSDPDYFSPVYNRSTSYMQPHLIVPIVLTESVTVKAFAAGAGKNASPIATFTYAAELPPPPDTLTFLFFSDTQPDPETGDFRDVGELITGAVSRNKTAKLIIFGGDTVNDGGNENEWHDFRQAVGGSIDSSLTAAVAGNHDNHAMLALQFDYPTPALSRPSEGFFYTFSLGPVFFVMLDSNIMGAANQRDIESLQSELQSEVAKQADWRIAVMHHPMWTVSTNPKDMQRAETMREHFLPLLETHGVSLILCGHQHVYARTIPMPAQSAANNGVGIVQIMAASGDKSYFAPESHDFIAAGSSAPNYLLLSVGGETIKITAYNEEHKAIDQFIIHNS